jgi:type IV pilus assembly protein PilV
MKNEKGFTLLEVLISMLVLAVGLLGLAPLMILSVETNTMSQEASMASNLAKVKIEIYQNSDNIPALPYEEVEEDIFGGYSRKTAIIDNATDSLIPEGLCHIQVAIGWTDNSGVHRSSTYTTFLKKD